MLKVKNLSVIDPGGDELVDVSFSVDKGEVVAVVGPNDSGKSLLARVVADSSLEHQGDISINHVPRTRQQESGVLSLGYSPGKLWLEGYLTGYEQIDFIGSVYGLSPNERVKRIIELAKEFEATDIIYRLIDSLSSDQQRIVSLMASIVHDPAVVIWDNPTAELDQQQISAVKRQLEELRRNKVSTLIISNDLGLVEEVADQIIIFKNGGIKAKGNISELKNITGASSKSLSEILGKALTDHE